MRNLSGFESDLKTKSALVQSLEELQIKILFPISAVVFLCI